VFTTTIVGAQRGASSSAGWSFHPDGTFFVNSGELLELGSGSLDNFAGFTITIIAGEVCPLPAVSNEARGLRRPRWASTSSSTSPMRLGDSTSARPPAARRPRLRHLPQISLYLGAASSYILEWVFPILRRRNFIYVGALMPCIPWSSYSS
jgi:hypothetical protein